MQLMNIEECVSIMIFADCEPHGIICNTSFRGHGASEQSDALSFLPDTHRAGLFVFRNQ